MATDTVDLSNPEKKINSKAVQSSVSHSYDDNHYRNIMHKQVEASLKVKNKSNHVGPIQNELTAWECWASSKADYLKNKQRLTRPMVL